MKSIKLIKKLVENELKELLGPDGGIMSPNMTKFVPHRQPGTDTPKDSASDNDEATKLYRLALKAREATETLIVELDDPIYDDAYESAYKATMCLRKTLNDLKAQGAAPEPDEEVVAPAVEDQPYGVMGVLSPTYSGFAEE
jgi:hypothetical protein|tara:strand:- start:204 stop:626 length:423 start_codon:yes stop_codon:yes gene_type:complete